MKSLNEIPRLKGIILETITLAEKLNAEYLKMPAKDQITIKGLPSLERYYNDPARITLKDYMDSCSIEEIIGLMSVMYLGRESGEFDEDGPIIDEEPKQLFERYYQEHYQWEKEKAIKQMTDKTPLSIYLRKGMALLNL